MTELLDQPRNRDSAVPRPAAGAWVLSVLVPAFAGCVLIVAAALKSWQLLGDPAAGGGRWLLIAAEAVLGVCLIARVRFVLARIVAVGAFSVFAAAALRMHDAGLASCGCLGALAIAPLPVAILDSVLAGLLLAGVLCDRRVLPRVIGPIVAVGGVGLGIIVPTSLYWTLQLAPIAPTDSQRWVGMPLTDLAKIESDANLTSGRWALLIYRNDCDSCRAALEPFAGELAREQRNGAVILLGDSAAPPLGALPVGRLAALRQHPHPFSPSARIELADGKIVAVTARGGESPPETQQPPPTIATRWAPGAYLADLGYLPPGARRRVTLPPDDFAQAPVRLLSSEIECSCTSVIDEPEQLGGRAIVVEFTAPREAQVYTKGIKWTTDAAAMRSLHLAVRARVGLPLRLEPPRLALAPDSAGGKRSAVTLINDGSVPLKLLSGGSSDADVQLASVPDVIPGGGQVTIEFAKLPVRSRSGSKQYRVDFATDCPAQPTISLTISVE